MTVSALISVPTYNFFCHEQQKSQRAYKLIEEWAARCRWWLVYLARPSALLLSCESSTRRGRSSRSCIISGKCCSKNLPTRASHVGSNINNNICKMSKSPAVCEISKQYSSRWAHLRQKCTCVTLPRKTSAGKALEHACGRLTLEELEDVMCRSCSLVWRLDRTLGEAFQKACVPHRQLRLLSSYSTDGHHWANLIQILSVDWLLGSWHQDLWREV